MTASVTTWNKGKAPAGNTGWNLTPDIRAAIESLNVLVPVADAAERDGITPPLGKYGGMAVTRADLGGLVDVWDGSKWSSDDSAPVVLVQENFEVSGTRDGIPTGVPAVSRTGRRVNLSGSAKNKIALSFAGAVEYLLGTIPAAYAPAKVEYFTIEVAFVMCRLYVRPDGEIRYMFATSIPSTGAGILHWSLSGIGWDK